MSANDFKTDLIFSELQHFHDWWTPHYRLAFPSMKSIQSVPGPSSAQRAGVDKFVILDGGKKIAVDEKVRRIQEPKDILLEYRHVSVDGTNEWPGWICKPNQFTDYLAIGFCKYQIAFFFPFLTLQAAWIKKGDDWCRQFFISKAANPKENPRYYTYGVCVPTEVLMGFMLDAMRTHVL